MNIIPYQPDRSLYQSTKLLSHWSEEDGISYSYAIWKTLSFIGNILWFLFLLVFLAAASVVWIWIASFRSGWQFWSWFNAQPNDQTIIATNLVYHFIIMVVSPFALFASWSQTQLQKWLGISFPSEVNLRAIIEEQLGFKPLGSEFTCLPTSKQESPDN
ncbi:hypothetical protein [Allocoleopsis sp.]|uniref:hypothetical protein n=1 Tax=Allocoleopsis sp. TaxID=3088169 RepID=UPI002FCE913E